MENIDKLLSRWNSRNLTSIGKITVIKTIIVPKINHLILTLPNPTLEFIRSFERKLFKFIWNEKPDKIKRSTLIQGYENAGLKMIDFENFMIALKSSWIRRLIFSNSKWTNLFKANFGYNMQTLMKFGIDFTNMIKKNSNNKFWKDVLQCWRTIIDVQKGNCDRMFNEHIWYNPNIKIDNKSVFFKDLFKSGFIYIGDLYENDDQMFSYNELKNGFNLKTN